MASRERDGVADVAWIDLGKYLHNRLGRLNWFGLDLVNIINPRCTRERVTLFCLRVSVCLSVVVTALAATYLVHTSKLRCQ